LGWFYLFVAGCLEVAGTTIFRYIDGWSKPWPILGFAVVGAGSLLFLYRALETVPLGTAYAIWTGLGAAGTVVVGMVWFGEPVSALRLALLFVLVSSIVGLKLISA
jgi:quaternary ammonium compound-resistance protein SugE